MKIILIEKLEKLGEIGDIINVKNGYAKNYLIPKQKALIGNYKNISLYKKNLLNRNIEEKKNTDTLYNDLLNTSIFIALPTKNENNLYEIINVNKIIKLLNNFNIKLKEKNFIEKINITKIGNYKINLAIENKKDLTIYLTILKLNK